MSAGDLVSQFRARFQKQEKGRKRDRKRTLIGVLLTEVMVVINARYGSTSLCFFLIRIFAAVMLPEVTSSRVGAATAAAISASVGLYLRAAFTFSIISALVLLPLRLCEI